MPKTHSLENQLARMRALRQKPTLQIAEMESLVASKYGVVAAAGAEMAAGGKREELIPALVAALTRFMENGEKTDPGCAAKLAIVNALCVMDVRDVQVYQRGMRCVQMEATWGGKKDTAAELRGRCAIALAECGAPRAVLEIVPLLVDLDPQARVGAVRAIGVLGSDEAAAILRLKLLMGDLEPIVLAECCLSLVNLSTEDHGDFVVKFLATEEAAAIDFATSLTESRDPQMIPLIRHVYRAAAASAVRKAITHALALMRIDGAIDFLLEIIEKELHPKAKEAIDSLKSRHADERLRARLEAAMEKRGDAALSKHYRATWPSSSA